MERIAIYVLGGAWGVIMTWLFFTHPFVLNVVVIVLLIIFFLPRNGIKSPKESLKDIQDNKKEKL